MYTFHAVQWVTANGFGRFVSIVQMEANLVFQAIKEMQNDYALGTVKADTEEQALENMGIGNWSYTST